MKEAMEQLAEASLRSGLTIHELLEIFHRQLLESALKLNGGNIFRTAQKQGMHRNTVSRQLQKFGVQRMTVAGRPWGGRRTA